MGGSSTAGKADSALGKCILNASNWLNSQLSSVMQLNSHEALCMEYHVCTRLTLKPLVCLKHTLAYFLGELLYLDMKFKAAAL